MAKKKKIITNDNNNYNNYCVNKNGGKIYKLYKNGILFLPCLSLPHGCSTKSMMPLAISYV